MIRENVITILPGGKLSYSNVSYDSGMRSVVEECDVTDDAMSFLFADCIFSDGITLKDIFQLVEANLETLSKILPYHIREFIEESKLPQHDNEIYGDIEICWYNMYDNLGSIDEFDSEPSIHLLSKGSELSFPLDCIPVNQIINHKVIQNTRFRIVERIGSDNPRKFSFGKKYFKLIDILRCIFYELSFYGPPSRRDENIEELYKVARGTNGKEM